jgi:hypothetical protein
MLLSFADHVCGTPLWVLAPHPPMIYADRTLLLLLRLFALQFFKSLAFLRTYKCSIN